MKKRCVFGILFFLLPLFVGAENGSKHLVVTTSKGVTICLKEFEAYYKDYRQRIRSTKSDDWYFNLSDKIAAAKELALQKIILNEAKRNHVEQSAFFRSLKPEMEKAFSELDRQARKEHLSANTIRKLKEKIRNQYLCKAYLNMEIKPYLQVSDDDVDNFLMAHQGMYALKAKKKDKKVQIIQRETLEELIRNEKRTRIADQLAKQLLNEYQLKIDTTLLRRIH